MGVIMFKDLEEVGYTFVSSVNRFDTYKELSYLLLIF